MTSYAAPTESGAAPEAPKVKLPSHKTRVEWVDDWEEKTQTNRALQMRDVDYCDGNQWTAEELEALKARNQPPTVKNRIKRKVDYVAGEERKKRVDPVAKARTPQHEDDSRAATDALRYVEEEQDFDGVRSTVIYDMLRAGIGGALKGVEDVDGVVKHTLTPIYWDRVIYDPHSRDLLFRDARHLGFVVWMDLEEAIEAYPDAEEMLRTALQKDIIDSETTEDVPRKWASKKRNRVKLCELYFKAGRDWYRSCFTEGGDIEAPERTFLLDENQKHSVCPLTLAACYRDKDGNPYGIVRNLISPQDEINKRASKSLHLLNVKQVIAEEGAVKDPQEFRTQLAKADGLALVEPGALQAQRVIIDKQLELSAAHVQMAQMSVADIDGIGPSAATMPELPNSASGRAFLARQQAAAQELGSVFDTLSRWGKGVFELDWLAIRQYAPEDWWLRVSDDQELTGYRFVALNRKMTRAQRFQELLEKQVPLPKALETAAGNLAPVIMGMAQMQMRAAMQPRPGPDGQPMPPPPPEAQQQMLQQLVARHELMQQVITTNQVAQMRVDIVIDEAPETAVLAQEEFATLSELFPMLVQARPDMGPTAAKLLVKASSLPNKRELLQDLEKGPDPKQLQQQQEMQQLQKAGIMAGVEVQKSQAQLNTAKAQQAMADAQVTGPKAAAEVEAKKAQAMSHAASAGATAGGSGASPQFVQKPGGM